MQINMKIWWSFVFLTALAFGLGGCNSPSPGYHGQPVRSVLVDGTRFRVHLTQYKAQAIRVSPEWNPGRGEIVSKGAKAIMLASSCPIRSKSLKGDEAMVLADLNCAGVPRRAPRAARLALDCDLASGWRKDGFGNEVAEIGCDLVEN